MVHISERLQLQQQVIAFCMQHLTFKLILHWSPLGLVKHQLWRKVVWTEVSIPVVEGAWRMS